MTARRIARLNGSVRPRAARGPLVRVHVPLMYHSTYVLLLHNSSSASPRASHALLVLGVGAVDVPLNVLLVRLPLSSAASIAIRHLAIRQCGHCAVVVVRRDGQAFS